MTDIKQHIRELFGRQFLLCMALGTGIYLPKIAGELPNPDAIWCSTIYKESWQWECGLGRYMIAFLQALRGNVINTAFVTMISLVFLSAVCVLVCRIFRVDSLVWQMIVSGLLMVSPSAGSVLTYYYCSDMYMLSYLLIVLAVWLLAEKRGKIGFLLSVLLISASAAIYQAYLSVAVVICLLYLLLMLTDEKWSIQCVFMQGVRFLGAGATGAIFYLFSNRFVQQTAGIAAVSDRGFSTMGRVPLGRLPHMIKSCYISFFEYFFSASMINNEWGYRKEINLAFTLCTVIVLVVLLYVSRVQIYRKILFAGGILALPIAVMSIMIMAPEVSILESTGVIMLPTMNFVYLAGIFLFLRTGEWKVWRKVMPPILGTACAAVFGMLLLLELSGQTYMKHNMRKMQHVAGTIVDRIEELVDQSGSYKLCIVGNMEEGNYPEQYPKLRESLHWVTASYKTVWDTLGGWQNCWISYMNQYMGKGFLICSNEDYQTVLASSKLAQMQNFPDRGSTLVMDEIIVIKLSEM